MKRFFGFAVILILFAAPAFAGPKPQSVVIPATVQVGSTQLPAGTYKLTWTGSGSSVQVTLMQNQKTILTFAAKEVDGKNSPGVQTYSHNGVVSLEAIFLSNASLQVEGAPQTGQ